MAESMAESMARSMAWSKAWSTAWLLCLLCSPGVLAQQAGDTQTRAVRYVDDLLTITVRTGRGTDFQIVRTLESGARVEVLESGSDGYSRIRMADGTEGWALTRYLKTELPARQRVAAAEQAASEALSRSASLEQQLQALRTESRAMEDELAQLRQQRDERELELGRLRAALGDASSAPARLEVVRARVEELSAEAERLRAINIELRDRSRLNWFLAGGGVLLGGVVLGLLLPRLRRRQRSSWGSL